MSHIIITGLTGSEKGKTYEFDATTVLLGAGQNCDITFDPRWDRTVDISHARLAWREGRLWLEDAGSRHGIYLDGRKVSREMLGAESVVELGRNGPRLKIEAPDATPGTANGPQAKARPKSRRVVLLSTWIFIPLFALVSVRIYFNVGAVSIGGGDSDTRIQAVAKQYGEAVGLVMGAQEDRTYEFGSCWAVASDVYVTNAHVAEPVLELLEAGGSAFVAVNERTDLRFRITEAVIHPKYKKALFNVSGEPPKVSPYDVALLRVQGGAPKVWKLADREKLETIGSGYRIAFLGFPMEHLVGDGIDRDNLVANLQSGIITSTTDFWLGKSSYEERLLINHNLPVAGGASGSPLFDRDGEVVGILFGGNMNVGLEVDPETNTALLRRTPSDSLVNFAQRVDVVEELLDAIRAKE